MVKIGTLVVLILLAVSEQQVPVTPAPATPEWRLGFDLGNMVILEAPELNPGNNEENSTSDLRLNVLAFSNTRVDSSRLLNTRQWAVLDQHGNVRQREFRWLGAFAAYYLVWSPAIQTVGPIRPQQAPSQDRIVFGVAGLPGPPPQVRTRLTQTPWKNEAPVESPDDLPVGYTEAKQDLRSSPLNGLHPVVYGSSMLALVRKRVEKLWLLNYGDPDLTRGTHPWGIFMETSTGLNALYVYRPPGNDGDV